VREHVKDIVRQAQHAARGHIPFAPRARKVFDLSLHEALQLGHNYLGSEHILLALVREGDNGGAAEVAEEVARGITVRARGDWLG
jgi:ATP-dependent Clp protease ATP-binding subunit ClpC